MEKFKIIVAHPGKQHSFKLASALKKEGVLFKYITTVYNKETSFFMKLTKKILGSDNLNRANKRRCEDLDDNEVKQFYEFSGLLLLFLLRIDRKRIIYNWYSRILSNKFGSMVAYFAIKNNVDAVILYDTNASACFKILKDKAPNIIRIMDVSAADRLYMKRIYEEEMKRNNKYSKELYDERKFLWENDLSFLKEETDYSQYFLVPSNFVKKSLEYNGVDNKKIRICPYGSNFNATSRKIARKDDILKILYVGSVKQMKGLSYLLEALDTINSGEVSLTIVGDYASNSLLVKEYKNKYNFIGKVGHEDVKKYLNSSDIFVFPSLGDGFGLSILEAMSYGLPVVCTTNTGASDVVVNGKNGFVVPTSDAQAIKEKIDWFCNNKDMIHIMGEEARKTALVYDWERYNKLINDAIKSIMVRSGIYE